MAATSCPKIDEWHDFSLGRVSQQVADQMGCHLDECPACVSTIQSLHDEDTLTEAMRQQSKEYATIATELVDEVAVRLRFRAIENYSPELSTLEPGRGVAKLTDDTQDFNATRQAGPTEGVAKDAGLSELFRAQKLSHYRIIKTLGEGGMGVVLEAEDLHLKRIVALKVMKANIATREGARDRFLREAQAAAGIEHENIITIYHVGEDQGVVFAAMPLLQGESLDQRLKHEERLSVTECLRITREIATGLAAAHDRQLIHRDIKPGNIWLEAGTGRVKILDFGLARPIHHLSASTDAASAALLSTAISDITQMSAPSIAPTAVTQQGAIVGTPAYMAPEQAQTKPLDGRCDLFSLGCVLYRLATGALPFQGADTLSTLLAVNFQDPKRPRELSPTLPVEVEDLILKLLAKKPDDRFANAQEVVNRIRTIERHLARRRLVRRLAIPVAAALMLVVLGTIYFYGTAIYRIATNRGEVVLESDDPDIEVVLKQAGEIAVLDRKTGWTIELTGGQYHAEMANKPGDLILVTDRFHLERNGKVALKVHRTQPVEISFQGDDLPLRIALKQDGKLIRTVAVDQLSKERLLPGHYDVELLNAPGRLKVQPRGVTVESGNSTKVQLRVFGEWREFDGHGAAVWSVATTKKIAATGGSDHAISVWNLDTGEEVRRLMTKKPVKCVALFQDGNFALSSAGKDPKPDFNVYLWDLAKETATPLVGHQSLVTGVAFSPDGTKAISGAADGSLILWDLKTHQIEKRFAGHGDAIHSIAFSPVGNQVASTAENDGVAIWDIFTGQATMTLAAKSDGVRALAFSPDGNRLVTGGFDNSVRIWDLATQKEIIRFAGHSNRVTSVAFSPDGKRVISGSADKTVRAWDIESKSELVAFDGHTGTVQSVAFSADGRHVLSASVDKSVRMWKLP